MYDANEIKKIIWDLMGCLHNMIFSSDKLSNSIIRLLFLKYAVDNSIGAKDLESMQCYVKAQKMFAMNDTENGLDTIIPVLKNIDKTYELNDIISGSDTIDKYAGELFGRDKMRQKKNASDQSFKRIMNQLGSLDMEEEEYGNHSLGQSLVYAMLVMMESSMDGSRIAAECTTSSGLARVAKAILNVQHQDTFCDFVSGKGLSTIEITSRTLPNVINVDVNRESAAISAMLLIMFGYSHFKVECADSLQERMHHDIQGNKIFADPPIGMKMSKTEDSKYTDSTLKTIDRVIHNYLTQDGIAVITAPSGPLFRQGPAREIKKEIVAVGLLHAVVALPSMWSGTSIGTNLLVLSKKPKFNVLFIDASGRAIQTNDKKRTRSSSALSDETICEIAELIQDPHDVAGFAKVISGTEIEAKEFNLVPANYIVKQDEEDTTTLADIDAQLEELYRQLGL